VWSWGDACTSLTDQYCSEVDCERCDYSWPMSSALKWDDPNAACRCRAVKDQDTVDPPTPPPPTPTGKFP